MILLFTISSLFSDMVATADNVTYTKTNINGTIHDITNASSSSQANNFVSELLLNIILTIATIIAFFFSHLKSYRKKIKDDEQRDIILTTFFTIPFIRIFPLFFLTWLLTSSIPATGTIGSVFLLISILIIKTVVDLLLHLMEHNIIIKSYENNMRKYFKKEGI
jgi:small-conductance mechanosensitive channel